MALLAVLLATPAVAVEGALEPALNAYEELRSSLVADQMDGVPAEASALIDALELALEAVGDDGVGEVENAILGARALARAGDLVAARAAFAEVSRNLVQLGSLDPGLVEGWEVFACPMVDTFNKWLQPTADLENPYMGPAMPKCGFASDWSVGERMAAAVPSNFESKGPEPEFTPGISGLVMDDVRDFKFLWREIDELQIWERGERITVAEFRSKAIEKTAHFLELEEPAASEFAETASEAVLAVREAFQRMRQAGVSPSPENQFSRDLTAAATTVDELLTGAPRHELFLPESRRWLLRLAFGPSERKESREVQRARAERGTDAEVGGS